MEDTVLENDDLCYLTNVHLTVGDSNYMKTGLTYPGEIVWMSETFDRVETISLAVDGREIKESAMINELLMGALLVLGIILLFQKTWEGIKQWFVRTKEGWEAIGIALAGILCAGLVVLILLGINTGVRKTVEMWKNANSLPALEDRVTDARGKISALEGKTSALEAKSHDKEHKHSAIDKLDKRMKKIEVPESEAQDITIFPPSVQWYKDGIAVTNIYTPIQWRSE